MVDLPTTLEGWTTIGANLVTMGAAISIAVILHVQLRLSVYFTRRAAYAQEIQARHQESASATNIDPQNTILNSVYLWAEQKRQYSKGMSPADVKALTPNERRDYRLWVSRLIAALDIVILDDASFDNDETQAKIEGTLAEHAPVLTTGWPFYGMRYAVSEKMATLIRKTIRGEVA